MGYVSVTLLGHFSYDFTIMCYENLDLKLLFFHLLLYGVAFVFKGTRIGVTFHLEKSDFSLAYILLMSAELFQVTLSTQWFF